MRELPGLLLKFKALSAFFLVCIFIYLWQTITSAPDKTALQKYHVTGTQLHQLALAIIIPYIVIWLIGLIGYVWLRNYRVALGESEDGKAFETISKGILLLVLWLPVSVLWAGLSARYYHVHPEATDWLVRIINYMNILVLLPAFYCIYLGSKQLVVIAKLKAHGLTQRQSMWFVIFAAFYVFIALSDSSRQVAHGTTSVATYYMPDWLTVLTVLVPRLLTWFIGFAAVSNIVLYRQKVKGAIYREALKSLAIGLGVVVVGITFLRVIQSLSAILGGWSIGLLVLLIYVLLFVLGFGYFMLAKGAKRLLKIEQS